MSYNFWSDMCGFFAFLGIIVVVVALVLVAGLRDAAVKKSRNAEQLSVVCPEHQGRVMHIERFPDGMWLALVSCRNSKRVPAYATAATLPLVGDVWTLRAEATGIYLDTLVTSGEASAELSAAP